MRPILSEIYTFRQHSNTLFKSPEKYKPDCYPYCYCIKLWCHGCYYRKPDRNNISQYSKNDLAVLRFKCTEEDCGRTCSALPECFAPRRWYLWINEQWCFWFIVMQLFLDLCSSLEKLKQLGDILMLLPILLLFQLLN